ncbi:MAG: class I SAM-dependent methyltransferase [Dehalococcoidia bacterium]
MVSCGSATRDSPPDRNRNRDQRQRVLDIGCGRAKFAGTIGVDIAALPGVNVVADLNRTLPFRDSSIDAVYSSHTLEHVDDFVHSMEEIWRVCRDGARVHIWVPHASCPFVTWIDPTHRRGFTIETFSYFDPGTNILSYYSTARYRIVYARLHLSTIGQRRAGMRTARHFLAGTVEGLANRSRSWQYRCERWWGPLIGFDEANVVLETIKH